MDSIPKRIIDAVVNLLTEAAPDGAKVKKGRKAPSNAPRVALVQVYWHQETSTGVGDPRKPVLMNRHMILEIKVTVPGDEDLIDPQRQWIVAAMFTAGRLNNLVKNISEGETVPVLEESSDDGSLTAAAIRYSVEYTTLPGDLTAGN